MTPKRDASNTADFDGRADEERYRDLHDPEEREQQHRQDQRELQHRHAARVAPQADEHRSQAIDADDHRYSTIRRFASSPPMALKASASVALFGA